mgnify:CR=1 FL=1
MLLPKRHFFADRWYNYSILIMELIFLSLFKDYGPWWDHIWNWDTPQLPVSCPDQQRHILQSLFWYNDQKSQKLDCFGCFFWKPDHCDMRCTYIINEQKLIFLLVNMYILLYNHKVYIILTCQHSFKNSNKKYNYLSRTLKRLLTNGISLKRAIKIPGNVPLSYS